MTIQTKELADGRTVGFGLYETCFNSMLSLNPRLSRVFTTVPKAGLLPLARDLYKPSRDTPSSAAICAMPFDRARALMTLNKKSISFSSRATDRWAIMSSLVSMNSAMSHLLVFIVFICNIYITSSQYLCLYSSPHIRVFCVRYSSLFLLPFASFASFASSASLREIIQEALP